ncbi:uncharacterized protein DS421_15g514500 [Arachis hypogaea]|nr:uncharacterized protein DS421_15g514500 [Arachis hypogaea]
MVQVLGVGLAILDKIDSGLDVDALRGSSRFTATAFSPPSSRLCSDPLRCVVVRGLSPPSELGCSRVSRLCVCSSCASCSCCLPRLSPSSHLPVPVHLFQEQCITLVDPLSAHNAFADITL